MLNDDWFGEVGLICIRYMNDEWDILLFKRKKTKNKKEGRKKKEVYIKKKRSGITGSQNRFVIGHLLITLFGKSFLFQMELIQINLFEIVLLESNMCKKKKKN